MALGMSGFPLVPFFMFGICCAGASQETCQGNVGNRDVYAPFGSWFPLNCTHNCSLAGWESRIRKRNESKGPGWVSVQVEVGTGAIVDGWRASNINCVVLSDGNSVDNIVKVIPYEIPRLVTADMEDNLEEGKSYNVTCTVHGVAPIQNLMVTVLRGEEVIHQKTFEDDSRVGNITQVVTYPITAQRSDNMKNYSCQATLALGTVIGKVTVKSSSVNVRTFGLPKAPKTKTSRWIEIGTELICEVFNAFPPDDVTVTMLFNNISLNVNKSKKVDGTVIGLATIPPGYFPSANSYQLHCKAELLGLSTEETMDIYIYESAKINLTLLNTEVLLGGTIRVSCVLTNDHPDQYSIVISLNGEHVCENPKWDCNATIKETSSMANVTCKAFLKMNQTITYTTQQSITVNGKKTWAYIYIKASVFIGLTVAAFVGTAGIVVYLCKRKG
ncbi:intercellular adhesion molecule 3 [Xenopus laevis]|uniref:Ig-like domain-containing protein n=2 Tax=Xenopus laevis TaxID=8355 RepID=A0A974HTZ6_XENLA|nr:intercellular adhesion molecule 3 [Xenopus laevis]OCT90392.1 hypothetical protein XELAEV_18019004mg [Xenopus laevis]